MLALGLVLVLCSIKLFYGGFILFLFMSSASSSTLTLVTTIDPFLHRGDQTTLLCDDGELIFCLFLFVIIDSALVIILVSFSSVTFC